MPLTFKDFLDATKKDARELQNWDMIVSDREYKGEGYSYVVCGCSGLDKEGSTFGVMFFLYFDAETDKKKRDEIIKKFMPELPKYTFGRITLEITDKKGKVERHASKIKGETVNEAWFTYGAEFSQEDNGRVTWSTDTQVVDMFLKKLLGVQTYKDQIGRGAFGSVYPCTPEEKKLVVKTYDPKKGSSIPKELSGYNHVVKFRDKVVLFNDPRVFCVPSDDWKSVCPFVVMRRADTTLNKSEFVDPLTNTFKHDIMRGYIKDVTKALQRLHGDGIAHYDIKPENIAINRTTVTSLRNSCGAEQGASLIDLGSADLTRSAREGDTNEGEQKKKKFYKRLKEDSEFRKNISIYVSGAITNAVGTSFYRAPEVAAFISGTRAEQLDVMGILNLGGILSEETISDEVKKEIDDLLTNFLNIGRKSDIYSLGASLLDVTINQGLRVMCGETGRRAGPYNVALLTGTRSTYEKIIDHDEGLKLLLDLIEKMLQKADQRISLSGVLEHKYMRK